MARRVRIDGSAEREVQASLLDCYQWCSRFPEVLSVFPMLSEYVVDRDNDAYLMRLGKISFGRFGFAVECAVRATFLPPGRIEITSDEYLGNTDASVALILLPRSDSRTLVRVESSVSPRMLLPSLIPQALVEATAGTTLRFALRSMLEQVARAVAAEPTSPSALKAEKCSAPRAMAALEAPP